MSTAPLDDVEYGIVADFAALQSRVAAQLTELLARAEAAEQQLAAIRWAASDTDGSPLHDGDFDGLVSLIWAALALGVVQPPEPAATLVVTSDNIHGEWAGPSGHTTRRAGSPSLGEPAKEQRCDFVVYGIRCIYQANHPGVHGSSFWGEPAKPAAQPLPTAVQASTNVTPVSTLTNISGPLVSPKSVGGPS